MQLLSEIASFWVFMAILWLPLLIVLCIPAFFSALSRKSKQGTKKKLKSAAKQEGAELNADSEQNETHRALVRKCIRQGFEIVKCLCVCLFFCF